MTKPTKRHIKLTLIAFGMPFGLALFFAAGLPAAADPADVTPLPPVTETDGFSGISWSFYYDTPPDRPYIPLTHQAGSRWDRFTFDWPSIEQWNNVWSFGGHDDLVDDLAAEGIEMIGILQMTPDWAFTSCAAGGAAAQGEPESPSWYPTGPRVFPFPSLDDGSSIGALAGAEAWGEPGVNTPPQGLYLAHDNPNNHWGHYVHTIVDRYEDQIKVWEMWNEVEWDLFWCGSEADYAQLLKVGYLATKAECPECTVLYAGLFFWDDPTHFERVLDILKDDPDAPANNYYFDVMSVHMYSRSSAVYDVINHIRGRMKEYVPDHPIWLTETGVGVWGDPAVVPQVGKADYYATQDEAAAYLIQSYANARAAGVERYIWFRAHDENMRPSFGLIRNDLTLRPAYVAHQVAATYLISPTMSTSWTYGDGTRRVSLWGTPLGKVSVIWSTIPTGHTFAYSATMDSAVRVDRWGVTGTITATAGVYTMTLAGATANLVSDPNDYIIGGDPLLVIETESPNEPPDSAMDALPGEVCATEIDVSWSGSDSHSGVWFYDVQVRDGAGGAWTNWQSTTTLTSAQFAGEFGHTYYFRVRATDRIGNRAAWPELPQAQMTITATSILTFSVGAFYGDENENGVWDVISPTEEITLTGVTMRLLDQNGQDAVIASYPTTFTASVCGGYPYRLWASTDDHIRFVAYTWPEGETAYTEDVSEMGLWPTKRALLPLMMRDE